MNPRKAVMGLTLVLFAAGVLHGSQVRDRDARWTAPAVASSKANPLSSRPEVVAGGRKLFQQRCTSCHGENGRGTPDGPDLTQSPVQMQTDGELFWKISGGNTRAGMPTFSFLPEPQRWQLVLELRELGGHM
jgi:mono/diheme cytochrome c family protein